MIKNNYIISVLQMDIKDYPITQRTCHKRNENIKNGLKEIDINTGLTKYEIGQIKSRKILSEVDNNGLRGYDYKGQKTRNTHMNRIDELGRNGYRRQADARLTTILENGLTVEQNAHRKQKETLILSVKKNKVGASNQSKKVLFPIIKILIENNIKYYFDKEEYGIKDLITGKFYFWDLTIPSFNIAIEYQSNAYHANPSMSENEWNNWASIRGARRSANEVLEYDYIKARSLYTHRKILTYYIWEKTQDVDVGEMVCLLKTTIMKF
jgi:hypothetical protein